MTDTTLHPDTTAALTSLAGITAGWLGKAGMTAEADTIRNLPPVHTLDDLAAYACVSPIMTSAYHHAGVLTWPQAQAGIDAARDALAARHAATSHYPLTHADVRYRAVDHHASWLWTIACYAAHAAVTNRKEMP
ncbi:hypothetical protein AB0B63_07425 [Micromonospora sp. NPDC049081]|uniref:hypothetical protein n=1 Tax=Micromonospora sp. NPDC049081 TaxID=3155150 RepID=UPI0033FF1546